MSNLATMVDFVSFGDVFSKTPCRIFRPWGDVVELLKKPKQTRDKKTRDTEVKLICPSIYKDGTTRGKENIEHVTMIVIDMDGGHDAEQFMDEWKRRRIEFFWYTSFSNTPEHPKWRAIFPLKTPVENKDWAKVWEIMSMDLAHGLSDSSCRDSSHMYFAPCIPTGQEKEYQWVHNPGQFLDPKMYVNAHVPEKEKPEYERTSYESDSPGNWFELNVSIDEVLSGWEPIKSRNPLQEWRRPGKDHGISATWGYRNQIGADRFYCFSSSTDLPSRVCLSKFAVYTFLNHHGDFKASAKAIAEKYNLKPSARQERIIQQISEPEKLDGSEFDGITLDKADPNRQMEYGICGNYIPCQELTLVEGTASSGKTTLLLGIAANGSNGYCKIMETQILPFRTLYIGKEQRPESLRRRFDQFGGRGEFFEASEFVGDLNSEYLTKLEKKIVRGDFKMIILDPIWEFVPDSVTEASRRSVQKWLTPLQQITERTHCSICMVNHFAKVMQGKPVTEMGYCNSALLSRARSHLAVFTNPNNFSERTVWHGRGHMENKIQPAFGFSWNSSDLIEWIKPGWAETDFIEDLVKGVRKK